MSEELQPEPSTAPLDEVAVQKVRRRVARQVDGLIKMRDPGYAGEFVDRLHERRRGTSIPRFELIPRDPDEVDKGYVVVGMGQAIVDRAAVTDGNRRELLRENDLKVVDLDRSGRLVLLQPGRRAKNNATDLVELLRRDGVETAGYNYIVPLGVVMKAEGGPENSPTAYPFPAVQIPGGNPAPLVAVIDTGVSLEQRSDGYLDGLIESDNVDRLDELPFPAGDGLLDAAAGHGSFVAGIVQQVAPPARLRMYKVTDADGVCTDIQVAAVIRRAAAEGADIINLSLGTTTIGDVPPPAMQSAIQDVVAARPEIVIVAAAGNNGDTVPVWPAAFAGTFDQVVSVAGLDPAGGPSAFSGRGPWVRCSAIGEGVASTYVIGTENGPLINDPDPDTFLADSWAVWTGTSFAVPQVSGLIARRCIATGEKPIEAMRAIVDVPGADPAWGTILTILPGTP